MKNDIAISVQNLSKSYKMYRSPTDRIKEFLHPGKKSFHQKFWALREVSFDIEKGTTFGIIGQNGSGKSTLLQLISGIIRPTNGSVTVKGRISALLELGAGFHRDFSGRENVFMQGALMGINRKEMEKNFDSIEEFADIGKFIDQPVKTYSSGMYVRLAFATAVNIDPDILIIDEVLAVGDDMFRRRCYKKLEDFQEQKKTILFVSHSLPTVTSICKEAVLIDRGNLLQIGSPKKIVNAYSEILAEREIEYAKRLRGSKTITKKAMDERLDIDNSSEHRFGTGEAEIKEFHIIDDKEQETNVLSIGQRYKFRTTVHFKKDVLMPDIGISIITLTGFEIYGICPTVAKLPMDPVESNSTIMVEFDLINNFNPGVYSVNVSVAEHLPQERVFLQRHLDMQTFKVVGDIKSYGLVDMNAKIKVDKI